MWRIDIGMYFCQLLFKSFRCTGGHRLLQFLQLLHVRKAIVMGDIDAFHIHGNAFQLID